MWQLRRLRARESCGGRRSARRRRTWSRRWSGARCEIGIVSVPVLHCFVLQQPAQGGEAARGVGLLLFSWTVNGVNCIPSNHVCLFVPSMAPTLLLPFRPCSGLLPRFRADRSIMLCSMLV